MSTGAPATSAFDDNDKYSGAQDPKVARPLRLGTWKRTCGIYVRGSGETQ